MVEHILLKQQFVNCQAKQILDSGNHVCRSHDHTSESHDHSSESRDYTSESRDHTSESHDHTSDHGCDHQEEISHDKDLENLSPTTPPSSSSPTPPSSSPITPPPSSSCQMWPITSLLSNISGVETLEVRPIAGLETTPTSVAGLETTPTTVAGLEAALKEVETTFQGQSSAGCRADEDVVAVHSSEHKKSVNSVSQDMRLSQATQTNSTALLQDSTTVSWATVMQDSTSVLQDSQVSWATVLQDSSSHTSSSWAPGLQDSSSQASASWTPVLQDSSSQATNFPGTPIVQPWVGVACPHHHSNQHHQWHQSHGQHPSHRRHSNNSTPYARPHPPSPHRIQTHHQPHPLHRSCDSQPNGFGPQGCHASPRGCHTPYSTTRSRFSNYHTTPPRSRSYSSLNHQHPTSYLQQDHVMSCDTMTTPPYPMLHPPGQGSAHSTVWRPYSEPNRSTGFYLSDILGEPGASHSGLQLEQAPPTSTRMASFFVDRLLDDMD